MRNLEKNSPEKRIKQFLKMKSPKDVASCLSAPLKTMYDLILNSSYKKWIKTNKRGKKRLIYEPKEELCQLQKMLNNILQSIYFLNLPEPVHGFVWCPKDSSICRTIKTNALPHCGKAFVINADIQQFFESISPVAVKNVFQSAPFLFNEEVASMLAMFCLNKNKLPTGAPTSPIISNFVFLSADKEIQTLAEKYQYTYTRYADDLTFSGNIRPDETFKAELEQILDSHGFKLNQRKFRVMSQYGRQTVTGLVVNQKPNVNRTYRKKVRALLHDIEVSGLHVAAMRHHKRHDLTLAEIQSFYATVMGQKQFIDGVRK